MPCAAPVPLNTSHSRRLLAHVLIEWSIGVLPLMTMTVRKDFSVA